MLTSFGITAAQDVFTLRRCGQAAAEALGMERQDQVRLATALSELGRDRVGCADLTVTFALSARTPPALTVAFSWTGGDTPSQESLHLAGRLVTRVHHQAGPERGRLVVRQSVPPSAASAAVRTRVAAALRDTARGTLTEDLRSQTRDLIATLEETRAQREELRRLNEELEATNKGVMALYAELSQELDETNSGVVALHTELESKSLQLREASEAKTRFWANVSHELRTPVNSVVTLSELLLAPGSAPLRDEQREQLSLVASAGQVMLALVDDLMDVAKAESGQLVPQPGPVDLRALVGQLGGELRAAYPSEAVLTTPDPASLPVVSTDETLLTRILRNLLSNALKFTAHGEVRLEFAVDTATAQPWLAFTVTDTGVGIPQHELARVFEEFYQVPGPQQRGRSGTGLGLPYARTLAELLGGTLTLTSRAGRGTRVELRLPDLAPPPGAPRRLLVTLVPDDALRARLTPLFRQVAGRTVEVDDPRALAETMRRERPEAVVVALGAGNAQGLTAVQQIGADPHLADVPLIAVVTGSGLSADDERLCRARVVVDPGAAAGDLGSALLSVLPPQARAALTARGRDDDR